MKRYSLYPECPEGTLPKKAELIPESGRKKQRYVKGWMDRLDAEQNQDSLNRLIYPEESDFSPPGRKPEDISNRREKYATEQHDIDGHLYIPYYHLPPGNARFIDSIDTRSLAATTTATVITAVTVDLTNAVLRWFGNELTDTTGYPNVSWTIYVNDVAWGPWSGITLSIGSIAIPTLIYIPLVLGDTYRVDATNNGSAAYTVRTRIKGWKW